MKHAQFGTNSFCTVKTQSEANWREGEREGGGHISAKQKKEDGSERGRGEMWTWLTMVNSRQMEKLWLGWLERCSWASSQFFTKLKIFMKCQSSTSVDQVQVLQRFHGCLLTNHRKNMKKL